MAKVDQARGCAESVASVVDAVLRAHSVRPWGIAFGSGGGFSNAINHLNVSGLFNPGLRDQVPMSIANLAGNWVAF